MRFFILALVVFGFQMGIAQQHLKFIVKDSTSLEPLAYAYIVVEGTKLFATTNDNGKAEIFFSSNGDYNISIKLLSYHPARINISIPLKDTLPIPIFLSSENEVEEVIVSSTRTHSRVEDLPTKVEVLGLEDMNEESTIVPGNVASILGDIAIITIQRINPVNGNDAVRMQGLDARYTQLMRDGFPLYSGFSGSIGVLAIPPLDLKQIEIIKGSASTLYGGGAISGLINFISKEPGLKPEATLILNATTLKELNANAYFSNKKNKSGFTLFTGFNAKQPVDVNGDGFTDVIANNNFTFHPRFFYDFNSVTKLILGITSVYDSRKAGDIFAVKNGTDSAHTFLEKEKSFRNTFDICFTHNLNERNTFEIKSAVSRFNRNLNYSGMPVNAGQWATYTEVSNTTKMLRHLMVAGINFLSENFQTKASDSSTIKNYAYATTGIFIQDNWQFTDKISAQLGLRSDYHNRYGFFVLPRISFFVKPSKPLGIRLGAGTGYKVPNLFDYVLPNETKIKFDENIKPENSFGINGDIIYKTVLFEKLSLQVDEALYYSSILNPITLNGNSLNNSSNIQKSIGTDTYIRLKYEEIEFYLGYNHTEAYQKVNQQRINTPFNPNDKISATLAHEEEGKWRMGIELSYNANQYIYNNQKVRNIWFMAAMIERKFKRGSIVLNCEDLLDQRQSRYEAIVTGTRTNPVFKPLWGMVEGRVINLSFKYSLLRIDK